MTFQQTCINGIKYKSCDKEYINQERSNEHTDIRNKKVQGNRESAPLLQRTEG